MRALPARDAAPSERPLAQDPKADPERPLARPARRSAVERLAADRAKYVRSPPGSHTGPASEDGGLGAPAEQHSHLASPIRAPAPVARRAVVRKPLRPDSLVIYRQKCEFVRAPGADGSRASLVKKLFQSTGKDKAPLETSRVGDTEIARPKPGPAVAAPPAPAAPRVPAAPPAAAASPTPAVPPAPAEYLAPQTSSRILTVPTVVSATRTGLELRVARRGGLHRSRSDLSSLYSMAKAEFDTFFQYCGLDPEVVEALGRENFSVGSDRVALKVRSVSVATSDSGFSRHSEDGLQEEELMEQVPSTTSVVERNARIIKWLYTCKKAKETPSQELQGPA
ncbi:protein FAM110C [Castor canadensis]|uniref:Protein FAM110C n=1 Tax=Castor canadensis TaxID=51338 RepID=A0AC58KJN5_CASCN